ncbi:phage holin family protein [Methyloversatilis sp.]|uniref:phage holin family protein n=1 Tax=Methyloversatilis sp. TaxID=2569862 RepID=UPI002736C559|nr:phage holin family protein [Methyloversatilis sp.]MDP2869173.1 phage holin family protein [Methyloversatilis sp.]MDP3289653.1 phage holin family protein [Methyloversatilis sp.]MDP3457200.1 phage holin family protein [Methyloversatilis sp.]MDP3576592.1 phage holin family protein [Methyloversatilis sp.]
MSESQRPERLAVSLKGFFSSLIELVHVRLELVTVEARDEALRLTELLVYGALAIAFLTFGIAFVAVLLTVLLWDSHRLLALTLFSTLFITLGVLAAVVARARMAEGTRLFASSLDELKRDRDSLRQ